MFNSKIFAFVIQTFFSLLGNFLLVITFYNSKISYQYEHFRLRRNWIWNIHWNIHYPFLIFYEYILQTREFCLVPVYRRKRVVERYNLFAAKHRQFEPQNHSLEQQKNTVITDCLKNTVITDCLKNTERLSKSMTVLYSDHR